MFGFPVLVGCAPEPVAPNPLTNPPVTIDLSPAEALGWRYRQETAADLNGDGSKERVVLASDVSVSATGVALWEDGHRWALVIQDRGAAMLGYAAFVPRGFVEAAILQPSAEGERQVLVQERSPDQLRALTVSYLPAGVRSVSAAHYQIESWLPGATVRSGKSAERPGIRFDPVTLEPGSRVGSLRVESIERRRAVDGTWVGMVRFSGELTLEGPTLAHPESDVRAVCFEAGVESAAFMPRWSGDERRPWFCLENLEEASRLLAPPGVERAATIVVDGFTIHRGLSDEVNSARLIRVLEPPAE